MLTDVSAPVFLADASRASMSALMNVRQLYVWRKKIKIMHCADEERAGSRAKKIRYLHSGIPEADKRRVPLTSR